MALPSPDSLIIVVGDDPSQLSHVPGATAVRSTNTKPPNDCGNCAIGVGINSNGIDLILGVVALALLFPLLIFVTSATRLSAAHREQRFAAMRLIGATPRQIAVIAAVESGVAAVCGMGLGCGLFYAARPEIAKIAFTGAPFFPSDLSLSPFDVLLVAVGVPLAAMIAARLALRRVQISPLGVSRRFTPKAPRAYRLIPLALGLAELSYVAPRVLRAGTHPRTGVEQVAVYLPGFLVVMAGLVIAGPWLTMVGSKAILRWTRRPAMLIAGRRLADNPQTGFRAISGLVLALFVTSVAVGVITTFVANRGAPAGAPAASTLVKNFNEDRTASGRIGTTTVPSIPPSVMPNLNAIPGVDAVAVVHADPDAPQEGGFLRPSLVSCAQLAHISGLGHCTPGANVATVEGGIGSGLIPADAAWPAADISLGRLDSLPVQAIVVGTDGSTAAIEQARTVLEAADPYQSPPNTINESNKDNTKLITEYQQLANVVILTSLPIAGCSLAASIAAGLSDRRRPFSLLRLTGVPIAVLRRVVALESAVPLLIAAAFSIAMGFLAAQLFLKSQLGYTLRPPGIGYYLIVAAGLVVSLGIIGSTLPLLRRMTGPDVVRNE
ncbi:MAG TPA: FtsX-like permease family protein [Micromonosporaceae bacterium]